MSFDFKIGKVNLYQFTVALLKVRTMQVYNGCMACSHGQCNVASLNPPSVRIRKHGRYRKVARVQSSSEVQFPLYISDHEIVPRPAGLESTLFHQSVSFGFSERQSTRR